MCIVTQSSEYKETNLTNPKGSSLVVTTVSLPMIRILSQMHPYCKLNLLDPELFFLVLAHPVYKMRIIQELNTIEL